MGACCLPTLKHLTSKIHIVGSQYFYGAKNDVHLKGFQPRGRSWVYHGDMTSAPRVADCFLACWCIMWATLWGCVG